MEQRFHDATIGQVAGGDIYNFGDISFREERRAELDRRFDWHKQQRDLASRALRWNRYIGAVLVLSAALVGTAIYTLFHGIFASGALVIFQFLLVSALAVTQWLGARHAGHYKQLWRTHNEALSEINRVLAVL